MKVELITVATRSAPGLDILKRSVEHNGDQLTILGMGTEWKGFGTKIILLRDYLKDNSNNATHFIFTDAYDIIYLHSAKTIALKYLSHFDKCIVFSTEKACWPVPALQEQYPGWPGQWKYLNSGSFMGRVDMMNDFLQAVEIDWKIDDQLFYTKAFLLDLMQGYGIIKLDYDCEIFQSVAFEHENDFAIHVGKGFMNQETRSYPSILHGNGRTDMTKFLKLVE